MSCQRATEALILATVAAWIAWDVYVYRATGGEVSISWTIYSWSRRHPFLSFTVGFLCGHLFAPMIIEGN